MKKIQNIMSALLVVLVMGVFITTPVFADLFIPDDMFGNSVNKNDLSVDIVEPLTENDEIEIPKEIIIIEIGVISIVVVAIIVATAITKKEEKKDGNNIK